MFRKIVKIFRKDLNQNQKLIKNMEAYEQKKRQEKSQTSDLKRDQLYRQKGEKVQK